MRVALYARVSTDEQAEKCGLPSQLRPLRELAARNGETIVAEFVDDGYSGTTLDRPHLSELRDLVRNRGCDLVRVYDPDRLARDLLYQLLLERELKQAGVVLAYCTVSTDDSPAGELQRQVLGAVAEFERKKIIERTVRGKREHARKGEATGGGPPPGYRYDATQPSRLSVDPERADVVRMIFSWGLDGLSLREIARRLNTQDIRPPRGGARWNRSTVGRILRNEAVAGRARYLGVEVAIPPIISRATFERVQAQLTRNRVVLQGRPARRPALLKGLLVCGYCGRRLHPYNSHGHPGYRCLGRDALARHPEPPCLMPSWTAQALEEPVWQAVAGALRDPDLLLRKVSAAQSSPAAERLTAGMRSKSLRQELRHVRQERARLLTLYAKRKDSDGDDLLCEQLEGRRRREQSLVAEIAEAEAMAASAAGRVAHQDAILRRLQLIRAGLDRVDYAGRRRVLQDAVDHIVVSKEKLEVHGLLSATTTEPKPSGSDVRNCPDSSR